MRSDAGHCKSARVLKIAFDRSCQSRIHSGDSDSRPWNHDVTAVSAVSALESKLGAFRHLGNVQIHASTLCLGHVWALAAISLYSCAITRIQQH